MLRMMYCTCIMYYACTLIHSLTHAAIILLFALSGHLKSLNRTIKSFGKVASIIFSLFLFYCSLASADEARFTLGFAVATLELTQICA